MAKMPRRILRPIVFCLVLLASVGGVYAQGKTQKPHLHGRHWMAIGGKPFAAAAGARTFERGGNAVDAACAMLGVSATIHDAMSWGGETQALIYHPETKKVIGINALGIAPTGATIKYFRDKRMAFPPEYGPLAALTPGTPGGLITMLAEYGSLSLEDVLAPSIELAEGYPMEASTASWMARSARAYRQWPESKALFLTNPGEPIETPHPGEIFVQRDLAETLRKLVKTERQALKDGKSRKEAIYAAYDRFYRGDIAKEFVRGSQEVGGLHTMEDLDTWQVHVEEPVMTRYKDIEVYKLTSWVQGPVLLQMLNMVETFDVRALGFNSAPYIHALYQIMNLAFADRDFYYGDPYFPPAEPMEGLLSKDYARTRMEEIDWSRNDARAAPGDPYPFQGGENPFTPILDRKRKRAQQSTQRAALEDDETYTRGFFAGTTTIQTADKEGWLVSITPSGGWVPCVIAGKTGVGMSQRMQSFDFKKEHNPYNLLEPGKRPRATLTPSIVLKDGEPYMAVGVQGGDTQEQNILQFLLNVVEFGMTVQEAAEAPNFNSYQMRSSFGIHDLRAGKLTLNYDTPTHTIRQLKEMGYYVDYEQRSSGPVTAIVVDKDNGSFWGGASNHGEDYGIAW